MVYIACFLALIMVARGISGNDDPCNATRLPYLTQRVNGYTLGPSETPICDFFLKPGWYSIEPYKLAKIENGIGCGTAIGWFANDSLPTSGDGNISVCQGLPTVKDTLECGQFDTISVKKCSDNHYVYNLVPTIGCDESFCIENPEHTDAGPPNLTAPSLDEMAKPNVIVKLRRVNASLEMFVFYCNISPVQNTDYFYTVEWSLTTGLSLAKLLSSKGPIQYVNDSDFASRTELTEEDLKKSNVTKLGFSIICSVKAMTDPVGHASNAVQSEKYFCGIQVINQSVRIEKPNLVQKVGLRLTVPFGCHENQTCELTIGLYVPRQPSSCQLSKVTIADWDREKHCQTKLKNSDVNQIIYFNITGVLSDNLIETFGPYSVQLITVNLSSHKIFSGYALDPIQVDIIGNKTVLKGKRCYAHSDPHIMAFDGKTYEHQYEGQFIMYRNNKYKTEVQIKTKDCCTFSNLGWICLNKPYCNCGVAVRVGRDVFVLDNCQHTGISDIGFKLCEDKILERKVTRDVGGRTFYVNMPSGTRAIIKTDGSYMDFFEVDIEPSLGDFNETEGLCGVFDSNMNNDGDSNIKLWSIPVGEDLFNKTTYMNLQSWGTKVTLCSCESPNLSANNLNTICNAVSPGNITCSYDSKKDVDNAMCSLARRRRSISLNAFSGIDKHQSVETSFKPKINPHLYHIRKQRNVFNNETAREECQRLMNTPNFQYCSKIKEIAADTYVDNCVLDALLTNSLKWTNVHTEGLRMSCIRYIEVNQPLTAESLEQLKRLERNSNNEQDRQSHMVLDPLITPEFLQDVKKVSCPYECHGQGICFEGTCICDKNFTNFDCSVDATKAPEMMGIPDIGLCDTSLRECAKTSVFAKNYLESESLSCRLKTFKVARNGLFSYYEDLNIKAHMESFAEVSCPLQRERSRRETGEIADKFLASGYYVSVSNDGKLFSEEDAIVIFDAKCVNCSKRDRYNITCRMKSDFCLHGEKCYELGESMSCYTCEVVSGGVAKWTKSKYCELTSFEQTDENSSKLWIIGAVVGPIVCFAMFAALIIFIRSKTIKMQRYAVRSRNEKEM